MGYSEALKAEAASWVEPDAGLDDKLTRERIRHYGLIKSLLLDKLPTHRFDIIEVGGGPMPVSDLLPFRRRVVVDPCTEDYYKIAPCSDHMAATIEGIIKLKFDADLIICTNALDHVRDWRHAILRMDGLLKHGGYMAILCAENNALTHPHPSHHINLTAADIHRELDEAYETVWQLTYADDDFTYGWVPYEGRCGQPAFAMLMRKAIA